MSDAQYPNRSDLRNPMTAVPGQTYGEAGRQMASQRAVPMGRAPGDATPRPQPGQLGRLTDETGRPAEPITSGAEFGAGPGMMEAGIPITAPGFNEVLEELMVLYRQFPNDDLAGLISALKYEGS
jgi:hypothetical protein